MTDKHKRLAVNPGEAAKMIGIGRDQAYEAVRTGEIPSVRIGRRYLVPLAWINRTFGTADDGNSPA